MISADRRREGSLQISPNLDFDALATEAAPRIRRFIERFVGPRDLSEDLTQEVFVHVLRHAGHWPPADRMMVWIFRIARNVALDALRREKVRVRTRQGFEELLRWREHRRWREERAPQLHRLTELEQREALEQAIQTLPEVYRTAFILREQEGLSYEEIAEVLDIPAKTVSTRLVRARRRLMEALAESDANGPVAAVAEGERS